MKIAICISGHIRTFEKTIGQMKKCVDGHDVDYFVHTWDNFGFTRDWTLPIDESRKLDLEYIVRFVDPVVCVIDEPSQVDLKIPEKWTPMPGHNHVVPKRVYSQFYKVNACDRLRLAYQRDRSISYDLVIRWRPDLFLRDFDPATVTIDPGVINILHDPYLPQYFKRELGSVSDLFACGHPDAMEKYASHFEHFRDYNEDSVYLQAEYLLGYHIRKMGLKVIELPITSHLIRG